VHVHESRVYDLARGVSEKAASTTQFSQMINLGSDLVIHSHDHEHEEGKVDAKPERERILQALPKMLDDTLPTDSLIEIIEQLYPELEPVGGSYALLNLQDERNRAIASIVSLIALVKGQYHRLTECQSGPGKLTPEVWDILQKFVQPLCEDAQLTAIMTYIVVRGLGKSKIVTNQLPKSWTKTAETVVLYLIEGRSHVVPSVNVLSDEDVDLVKDVLSIGADVFNVNQFMQAENLPASVEQLQRALSRTTEERLNPYLLCTLAFTCGLAGASGGPMARHGSRFLNNGNGLMMVCCLELLGCLDRLSPQAVYWNYILAQMQRVGWSQHQEPTLQELAIARLLCLCRSQSRKDCEKVLAAWDALDMSAQNTLQEMLLADGLQEPAFYFTFLPQCFVNSMKNKAVGLTGCLKKLVIITHKLRLRGYHEISKVVLVDLSDFAAFVGAVKSSGVYRSCMEHAKFERRGGKSVRLTMSHSNWSHVRDLAGADMSDNEMLRHVVEVQTNLDSDLREGRFETTGGHLSYVRRSVLDNWRLQLNGT